MKTYRKIKVDISVVFKPHHMKTTVMYKAREGREI